MTITERKAEVERLLAELAQTRQRIYVSKAFGVRAAALRDLKSDFRSAQQRLVALG